MKKLVLVLMVLLLIMMLATGCSVSIFGKKSASDSGNITVTTCPQATTVGDNSCTSNVTTVGGD